MGEKRKHQRNFWSDILFIDEIRDIKRARSMFDKKDYSDAEITNMIAKDPLFQELKRKMVENNRITAKIKIQMDRKRGGNI